MTENDTKCDLCGRTLTKDNDDWVEQTKYHTSKETHERTVEHFVMCVECHGKLLFTIHEFLNGADI